MNHFMSRLGRSRVGKYFMPTIFGTTVAGYLGVHTLSHDFIRKLFAAQTPDGSPIFISSGLRDIITEVFIEIDKAGFHEDIIKIKGFEYGSPPTIRWFNSATLDPIVYGMTDFKTGCSVGIPNHYNYQDPYDLPDDIFDIKKFTLIRTAQARELDKQIEADKDVMLEKQQKDSLVMLRSIDRNSQEGKDFSDSLILSENAKRFSIARELYICDSYRPLYQIMAICIAFTGSIVFARAQVNYFKLKDRHVSQRLPAYAISTLAAYFVYSLLSEALDEYVDYKATERAKKLGDNYVAGSEEFFSKRTARNAIIEAHSK